MIYICRYIYIDPTITFKNGAWLVSRIFFSSPDRNNVTQEKQKMLDVLSINGTFKLNTQERIVKHSSVLTGYRVFGVTQI